MQHLLFIIVSLSLTSAIPLPQFDLPTTSDIVTDEPWGITSTDAASTNTFLPNSPILLSEIPQQDTSTTQQRPAPNRSGVDGSWTGKDRVGHGGDRSGMGDPRSPDLGGFSEESSQYWKDRGFPRIPSSSNPAKPPTDGGVGAPPPIQGNDAGVAGTATLLFKGLLDNLPPGLNTQPARNY